MNKICLQYSVVEMVVAGFGAREKNRRQQSGPKEYKTQLLGEEYS